MRYLLARPSFPFTTPHATILTPSPLQRPPHNDPNTIRLHHSPIPLPLLPSPDLQHPWLFPIYHSCRLALHALLDLDLLRRAAPGRRTVCSGDAAAELARDMGRACGFYCCGRRGGDGCGECCWRAVCHLLHSCDGPRAVLVCPQGMCGTIPKERMGVIWMSLANEDNRLGAIYEAGSFRMSTWIPFVWALINSLVIVLSSFAIQGGL